MTSDERDPRERPDEEPDQAADEFETASWPVQDAPADRWSDEASREEEPPPAVEEPLPVADDSVADQVAARADQADEADATPPSEEAAGPEAAEEPESPADAEAWPAAEAWPDEEARPAAEPAPPPPDVEAYAAAPPAPATEAMPAHSVPATEPGESTQCPRCGTENRPGVAFCRNCGQRLVAAGAPTTVERPAAPEGTQVCPRCGTHNRAGVAFCQNCGANMRAAATPGYVPPAVAPAGATEAQTRTGRALLGPIVLLIGAAFIAVAWLLPFPFGSETSLFDRAFGAPGGYGIAFWNGYQGIADLASQAYFGFAAPAPVLVLLLAVLAIAGFLRPAPAVLQWIGLGIALIWAIGLGLLFVLVEVLGGPGGGLVNILRNLTAGGIIFFLASLIVVIGALTRFGRS
ncbi:MAG TPA: zinc ribbon domain-containing protein [Candidatus Limnocylindria bacterium]